jgi:hypothetical protein
VILEENALQAIFFTQKNPSFDKRLLLEALFRTFSEKRQHFVPVHGKLKS